MEDPFPWDSLPLTLQESILSLLPISTLIRCTTLSRSFQSLIRSPTFISSYRPQNPQLFFLFSDLRFPISDRGFPISDAYDPLLDRRFPISDAYDPLLDRWISLPIPLNAIAIAIHASDGPLLMAQVAHMSGFVVSDLFTMFDQTRLIPPMLTLPNNNYSSVFYPIALISETRKKFKIVAVSTCERIYSQVYDSGAGKWELKGGFGGRFALVGNGVCLDGLLYCLSRGPDSLLSFDPVGGQWNLVDVNLPANIVCWQLLVFDGGLFLVGGVEDFGVIVRIGIWEVDLVGMELRVWCIMPDEFFGEFCEGGLNYFETVDRKGKICFYKISFERLMVMCDLEVKRWWWPRACEGWRTKGQFAHAVEPYIDLVKTNP